MKRYAAVRHDDEGFVVVGTDLDEGAAREAIVTDRLELPWPAEFQHVADDQPEFPVRAVVVLSPSGRPVSVYGVDYSIIELPDDQSTADWLRTLGSRPPLLKLVCVRNGQFRVEIFPNEGQHRGRPHCKVTYGNGMSGSFEIPGGEPLHPGRLKVHEAEATKLVRREGSRLQEYWDATRPLDQRL